MNTRFHYVVSVGISSSQDHLSHTIIDLSLGYFLR